MHFKPSRNMFMHRNHFILPHKLNVGKLNILLFPKILQILEILFQDNNCDCILLVWRRNHNVCSTTSYLLSVNYPNWDYLKKACFEFFQRTWLLYFFCFTIKEIHVFTTGSKDVRYTWRLSNIAVCWFWKQISLWLLL